MRSLIYLACPAGMGLMMWVMMRGQHDTTDKREAPPTEAQQTEIAHLRAELDQLRSDPPRATDPTR